MKIEALSDYFDPEDEYGPELMTIQEFRDSCYAGGFVDDDGHGYYVVNNEIYIPAFDEPGFAKPSDISHPSRWEHIPSDATHVLWFNK